MSHDVVRLLAMAVMFGVAGSLYAVDGKWTSTTGGLWSDTANWSGGAVANGSGSTANFGTIDATTDVTVHLDSARTISGLAFGDAATSTAAGWTLDNNGSAANYLVFAGGNTVTVNALGANKAATISLMLAGSAGLTKMGAGTLVLSGANSYTGTTTVTAGTLAYGANNVITLGDVFVNGGTLNMGGY
ncbi:MAG: autotransporter-associated beta strand repeat-containing protein, partial [Thermoguttaceae bacterium]